MDETLSHYGIIGMKWGIRRTPEQLGHAPKSERKAFKKQVKQDEKDYRRQRREVSATQKNLKKRYKMLDESRAEVDAAEKASRKALRKVDFPWGKEKRRRMIEQTDRALDAALENSERARSHEKQARDNAKKAITKMEKMVQDFNDKYGSENVKQLKTKDIKRGIIIKETILENGLKTGINATNLPIFGRIISSNIISNIEREDRERLMNERLNDYERKKYA